MASVGAECYVVDVATSVVGVRIGLSLCCSGYLALAWLGKGHVADTVLLLAKSAMTTNSVDVKAVAMFSDVWSWSVGITEPGWPEEGANDAWTDVT